MRSSDVAYEKIKEMVLTAELEPGEVIVDSELMEKLDMGRTPIREALNRLSWEGQIRIIPRHCIMVSELSNRDVESIYQVRYTLSILEGELASKRRTEEDLNKLEAVIRKTEEEKEPEKRVLLDRQFHITVAEMTRNDFLINEMKVTTDLCTRLLFMYKEFIGSINSTVIQEYEDILQSIREQDSEKTISLLQHHLLSFRDKFI